jgi:hypothetical protein
MTRRYPCHTNDVSIKQISERARCWALISKEEPPPVDMEETGDHMSSASIEGSQSRREKAVPEPE